MKQAVFNKHLEGKSDFSVELYPLINFTKMLASF